MQVIIPGHKYTLNGKGKFSTTSQDLQFVSRDRSGELQPGVTNEEVLSVLLDRLFHQQGTRYSEETAEAISLIKQAKKLLTSRTASKKEDGSKHFNKEEF